MRIAVLIMCIVVAQANAAPSADWTLVKASVAGPSNDLLFVESSILVRADIQELRVEAWRGDTDAVMADIDVIASDGSKLASVLSTGPAEAFRKTVIIRPGESHRFEVFTKTFTIGRSGSYVASGKLLGVSAAGQAVDIPLRNLRFDVEVAKKKAPIQPPQPTTDSSAVSRG